MTRTRRWINFLTGVGFAVVFSAIAFPALASITGGALNVTATNESGDYATIHIDVPPGPSPWIWSSNEIMEMRSLVTNELIAVLNPENKETRVEYVDDPIINLTFSALAGPSPTQFVITSGLLSFPTMPAEGRASVGYSLTDSDGDGATLTGIGDPNGAQGAYLAQYNGFAGTLSGTTFAEFIPSMSADAFSSSTQTDALPILGFLPIPDPVSDMSVLVSFELSANDQASGTTTYVIQQPPTSVETVSWGRVKSLFR
jgi:hypothetical protein